MIYALALIGVAIAYKLGKEVAREEIRERLRLDELPAYIDEQRRVAGMQ